MKTMPFAIIAIAVATMTAPLLGQGPEKREMTEEEKARIAAKAVQLAETAKKLDEIQKKLEETKARLRQKFEPTASDAPDMLWGKMLRFRSVNMPEDAAKSLELLRRKNSRDFLPGAISAAEALCRLGPDAPTVEGVMISSYEPPATSHAIFKPGDIVVARDGQPVRRVEDWKTSIGSRYRFWRMDGSGQFRLHEAALPAGQPRVGLVNVAEEGAAETMAVYANEARKQLRKLEEDETRVREERAVVSSTLETIENATPDAAIVAAVRAAAKNGADAYASELAHLGGELASNLRRGPLTPILNETVLATISAIDDITDTVPGTEAAQFAFLESLADAAHAAKPAAHARELETNLRLAMLEEALRQGNRAQADHVFASVKTLAAGDELTIGVLEMFEPAILLLRGEDALALRKWNEYIAGQREMAHGAAAADAYEAQSAAIMRDLLSDMKRHGVELGALANKFPGL